MPKKRTRTDRSSAHRPRPHREEVRGGYELAEPEHFSPEEDEDYGPDADFEDTYDEDVEDLNDGIVDLPDPDDFDPDDVEYVPVFRMRGRVYEVPKEPSASIGLTAMEILDERGDAAATRYVLEAMLGEDGYQALATHPALPSTRMTAITGRIMDIVMATQRTQGSGKAQGGGRMRPAGSGGGRRRTPASRSGGGSGKRRRR